MERSDMEQLKSGATVSKRPQLSSPARRHFLAVSGAVAGKAAAAVVTIAALSSSAEARGHGHAYGRWGNPGRGHDGPGCFLKGTRVLTERGEAPIEHLQIGDLVVTARGNLVPIKWIGRNTYQEGRTSWPKSVIPIRVSRGAIDDDTPHADLYLSPAHALYIDGVLMPVNDLVNGTSIVAAVPPGIKSLDYFQIVAETHEIVSAEGAPAETFSARSDKEYRAFANFAEYEHLYPNDAHPIEPIAVNLGTARAHLSALLGVGMSYFMDVPDPLQGAYERIAWRAGEIGLAA